MDGRVGLFNLLISGTLIHFVHTGREFFSVNTKLTWTEAQTYCREKFTDLVTVLDDNENQKLMALAQSTLVDVCIWIGLRHNIDNWRWSNGVSTNYVNNNAGVWAIGEPNNRNGNQYCAMLSNGLFDRECASQFSFVCFEGTASEKYVIITKPLDWSSAQEYCRKNYNDLASISNQDDLHQLKLKMNETGTTQAWIGLYRDPWNSWSDNSTTNFGNWEIGHPLFHTNDFCGCLSSSKGKWNDVLCNTRTPFFCYGDGKKQIILKIKLQSDADINNSEIQQQILDQMKSSLASIGETIFTLKSRVTMRTSSLVEPAIEENVEKQCDPL